MESDQCPNCKGKNIRYCDQHDIEYCEDCVSNFECPKCQWENNQ